MINGFYVDEEDGDEYQHDWTEKLPGAPSVAKADGNIKSIAVVRHMPAILKRTALAHPAASKHHTSTTSISLMSPNIECCSASAPIIIAGKKWSYRLSISSMLPNEAGIQTLRETFEIVKKYADEVALQGMQRLLDRVPGAAEVFARAGRIRHSDDEWELIQMGRVILSALEKCISRISNPNLLRLYLSQLTKVHNRHGVRSTEIPFALHAFESAILRCLRPHHNHVELPHSSGCASLEVDDQRSPCPSPLPLTPSPLAGDCKGSGNSLGSLMENDKVCFVCMQWRNFFDLINVMMVTDMKE